METVLVTGGSGFIAVHTIAQLLSQGYQVRASLRKMTRQGEVQEMLKQAGVKEEDLTGLSFVKLDLMSDENWATAMSGVDYVMHIASPTPNTRPDAADAMVKMAVDGVKRVMTFAKAAGVKRVMLTSASGAVLAGHGKSHPQPFTEKDWSNLDAPINAYQRSKTVAEQAAWELSKSLDIELASVLPVAVMGPVLGSDQSHSNDIMEQLLSGKMPFLMNLSFDYVDVRDVASLQILAMTRPEAAGQRFLATSGENVSYKQQSLWLKEELGEKAANVTTFVLPDFAVRLLAHFIKALKMPATFLGQNTACSKDKAAAMLGWQPRSAKAAILATATSMLELGKIK